MNKPLAISDHQYSQDLLSAPSGGNAVPNAEGLHLLLENCLSSGQELRWNEFICRSQPVIAGAVIKSIRRWTRPAPALVDDLVQETYVKLFAGNARALRRFICQHENALYGFLKVVASNTVQDHFRSSYSQKRGSGHEEENIEEVDGRTVREGQNRRGAFPIFGLHHGIERRVLLQEIDAYLKSRASEPGFSRDYAIFWLYYRVGLTAKAISDVSSFGLTVKGVESSLLRLIRLVRARMDQGSAPLKSASYPDSIATHRPG